MVGCIEGVSLGDWVGCCVGVADGDGDGAGDSVGISEGAGVGFPVMVGSVVGVADGLGDGAGDSVGPIVGVADVVACCRSRASSAGSGRTSQPDRAGTASTSKRRVLRGLMVSCHAGPRDE